MTRGWIPFDAPVPPSLTVRWWGGASLASTACFGLNSAARLSSPNAEGLRSCEYFIDYSCWPLLDSNSVEATGSLKEGGRWDFYFVIARAVAESRNPGIKSLCCHSGCCDCAQHDGWYVPPNRNNNNGFRLCPASPSSRVTAPRSPGSIPPRPCCSGRGGAARRHVL